MARAKPTHWQARGTRDSISLSLGAYALHRHDGTQGGPYRTLTEAKAAAPHVVTWLT